MKDVFTKFMQSFPADATHGAPERVSTLCSEPKEIATHGSYQLPGITKPSGSESAPKKGKS